jgi:MFS transporter, SHS family, sialic acid transporter
VKESGARTHPLREIFSGAVRRRTLLGIAFASVALIVTWGAVQWLTLWADQMSDNPKAKGMTQLLSALGAVAGCFLGALAGGRFGRRITYFLLCLGSLIAGSILFRAFDSFSAGFLAMVFVVGGLTASFYGWLPLYLPELFPTRMRATGQGLSFNAGRILAAAGALQMSALMGWFDESYARAGATIVLVYLVGMVLIFFAPETKGKPLPE